MTAAVGAAGCGGAVSKVDAFVDPIGPTYRRAVNTQLTVQESRHRLARAIFHGRRGQIFQR